MHYQRLTLLILSLIAIIAGCNPKGTQNQEVTTEVSVEPSVVQTQFTQYCSGCHGVQMQAFADRKWKHGKTRDSIIMSIKSGYVDAGMPSFDSAFTDEEMGALADYILEGIENVATYDFQDDKPSSNIFPTEAGFSLVLDTIATGLESPWGMAFLPDGGMLINDKNGKMYRLSADRQLQEISGVPEVRYKGQGGLLDVEIHPDFEENNLVYLSYSKPKDDTLGTTAIFRARLEGTSLIDGEDIFIALPYATKSHHYGSRLEFDQDGYLFFSVGDRGSRDVNPQNLDNHCGKIHRINDDGSIPVDNPFINDPEAMHTIWSLGHRNPQGVAMHPVTGKIWEHEHGPRGGDELNRIEKGLNYGWPVISYGINYDGTTFTQLTEKEGMEQPVHYWVPSIAACGMTFVKSDKYPGWENQLLVGSLRYKYLNLCKMEDGKVKEEKILLKNIGRLRSVEVSPEGYIYVGVEGPGSVYRLIPESNEEIASSW